MSTFAKPTRHPQKGTWELAQWIDDYFGPHIYGVRFESDKKVYPVDIVERNHIYDFWADDVIQAFTKFLYGDGHGADPNEVVADIIDFLNLIQKEYKARWQRDPATGEGATDKSVVVRQNRKN